MLVVHGEARSLRWGVWLAAAMLVFAPMVRGGNRPLALIVLELSALALLVAMLMRPGRIARVSAWAWAAMALLVIWPVLQLLPLPFEWWAGLPGREDASAALEAAAVAPTWMQVSLVPPDSERALWALLPPLALFCLAVSLEGTDVSRLLRVFMAVAVFQALLGLIQYGGGADSALRFRYGHYADSAIGTYANRNHLAGMLVMALPIALALLAAGIFRMERRAGQRHGGWIGRLKMLAGAGGGGNRTALWALVSAVLLLGIVFARSRMGIAVGIAALVLVALVLLRNFGAGFATRMVGMVVSLAVVAAVAVGLAPVLDRFSADPTADARWPNLVTTLELAGRYFPLGSGPGTFVEAFSGSHPEAIGGDVYVNHAHNDYAEWLMEGGLPVLLLLLLLAGLFVARWRKVWAVRSWEALHMMQVGSGVGLLALALFGLTDYNLRIPANQIYFALLAAVFFHPGEPEAVRRRARHGGVRASDGAGAHDMAAEREVAKARLGGWDGVRTGAAAGAPAPGKPAAQGSRNPFMD